MNAVLEELYYTANNEKIADKKKADYQEGLEKSRADSAARSRDSHLKDPEKSCARSRESYMKNQQESRADSAARRRVAMIVLHGAVSIGIETGGLRGQFPPNIMLCIKELTVIKE